MADVIKSDIEKIERALNIRVEDVEIEVALNAAYPQTISKILDEQQVTSEQIDDIPDIELIEENSPRTDPSSLLTFATALNLCYQRKLFQLSKYCQSLSTTEKVYQSSNETLPLQSFEFYSDHISSHLPVNSISVSVVRKYARVHFQVTNESIQNIRRMMQREEKARLSSNETTEKLIECVAENLRKTKEHELTRRIEILQTSTRDIVVIDRELQNLKKALVDLRTLSNRELIQQEGTNDFIDWTYIAETLMNNQYTVKCCRHAWQQLCLPTIRYNHDWSEEEDQLLRDLVQIHGPYADQWPTIASNFSQRSALMCATRYMSLENSRIDKLKFSNDQLNEFKQMVEEDRHNNYIPLNKIAYKLGCSLSTIHREWRRIDPDVRRGQWQALLQSVSKQSNRRTINWNLVACDVPGRSQTKCYNRYVHLTRERDKIEFRPEDDQVLIEQHQLQNARWAQIQPFFPGRSCYTLQNRLRKLMQYRHINELFHVQQITVQSFILRQFPSKEPVIFTSNSMYQSPAFQLTYDQLQYLTSNSLFIQLCNEIDLNQINGSMGIRQFLNKLSTCQNVDEMKQHLFSMKATRRRTNK
ncbi:unnamed protein product [Adineta ricciae]|uniref:snRNA-activating protein complex subunit 4 n=1 Tax=Adineta ricciae TaxID=249248 RepID=A0A813Z9M7_ADIRI|nr:unnamed protein product [Adineta ricciae]CAF1343108.1 unnamed protein product [Adineta ricciae]